MLAIGGWKWLGAITPIGGAALVIGWLWLAASFRKTAEQRQNANGESKHKS